MELEVVLKWMELFNEKVQAEKVKLTELDTPIGDADHGNNMSRGISCYGRLRNRTTRNSTTQTL